MRSKMVVPALFLQRFERHSATHRHDGLGTALVSVCGSPADNLTFEVPWVNLGVIFAALYRIALATTCRPAQSTVWVCPAEALRYQ